MKIYCPKGHSLLLTLTLAVGLWLAQPAAAYTAGNGITGSPHDITSTAGQSGGTGASSLAGLDGRICVTCHTPHNGGTAAPLWNHAASAGGHTPYDSATMNATTAAPTGISLICLSCHDGSTAIDQFGGGSGTAGLTVKGSALLDVDLSNDHPVGFTYNDALATADGALHAPTTTDSGLGLKIDDDMLFGGGNDQMECASCHEVHNGTGTQAKLLVKANTNSALCFTCHNK